MIKKGVLVFCLISLALISLSFIHSAMAEVSQDVQSGLDTLQGAKENVESLKETARWEFVSEQWRTLLLKNKAIAAVDSGLQFLSPVFLVILGESYVLSFTFFVVLLLWIYFLFTFAEILRLYSLFTKWVAVAIAVGINIIVAQFGMFHSLAEMIFKAIFYKTGVWSWLSSVLIIGVAIFVYFIAKFAHQEAEKTRKIRAEQKQETDQKYLSTFVDTLKKGISKGGA